MTSGPHACRPAPSLSASVSNVLDSGFPLLLSPDGASPRPSLFSSPVKTTVAISTVKLSYTPKIQCQVESTLSFALILRAFCGNLVDKLWKELWMKMWKIGQVSCYQKLNNLTPVDRAKRRLCFAAKNKLKKKSGYQETLVKSGITVGEVSR